MSRCLYCYQPLENQEIDFHKKCSKRFFGVNQAPVLNFGVEELKLMAQKAVAQRMTVTGVQPKLSLSLEKVDATHNRLTIVGLWGDYILKPPTEHFPQLPENEDVTMKLAALCGIRTAEHSLIRLTSGELAYLTKRFDRQNGQKIHVEDLCQLTGTLTEHKYRGSMEKVGKAIKTFSTNTGLDALSFFELSIFCFLTGNADMHLKNFSLIHQPNIGPIFSPAYDLVATALVNPNDDEDLALTLNGRKKKINRNDFISAFTTLGLDEKQQENIFKKMAKAKNSWFEFIDISFLSTESKAAYKNLIQHRFDRLNQHTNN